MRKITPLSHEELLRIIEYKPESGLLFSKVARHKISAGELLGGIGKDGYEQIFIYGRNYRVHRLVWFYMTSEWPAQQVDHINRDRQDNRWCNLRHSSGNMEQQQNKSLQQNNTTGIIGVSKTSTGFRADIMHKRQNYHFYAKTSEECKAWYDAKKLELHQFNPVLEN